ncbi:arylesterase [Zunongwangia atlantica]|uniref:GDSL-like lipase/acylhydrolase n=2 Tax=Zunongwangia TaxID=417127 RepID=A0A1Y1T364_9FLAO|nr:arylesterase [Zunongwangia atlantica]ORL45471.1 GDSL-like lipase/acylhydrolase [Zunongwangia atlantica 22II14-10F7]
MKITNLSNLILAIFCLVFLNSCKNEEKQSNSSSEENTEKEQVSAENTTEEVPVVLFFGTSLTAGLGLDTAEAYPALIQKKMDSLGMDYSVVNAGLSGETTASGLNRLDWVFKQNVDILVIELGANDGLRGVSLDETRSNLEKIIKIAREKNPEVKIILAGMQIPPNMGEEYTTEFRSLFPELAKEYDLELIPFLLEGVAGDSKLNQQDGIHPTAEGQQILANNVWEVLKDDVQ